MDDELTTLATAYDAKAGLRAATTLFAIYAGGVAACLLLRFEAVRWGFRLLPAERAAVWIALIGHLLLVFGAVALAWALRRPRNLTNRTHCYVRLALPLGALLSCDVLAGVWAPPAHVGPKAAFEEDDQLGWTVDPKWHGRIHGVETQVNEMGLRGETPAEVAPSGTQRVLCLGDSIAFGYGVNVGESFVSLLPKTLAGAGCDARVQTLNFGVPGYAPWQQAVQLQELGLPYKPDVVLHSICLNDFVARRYFDDVMESTREPAGPLQRLAEHSGLFRLGRALFTDRPRTFDSIAYARLLLGGPAGRPEVQLACESALADLRRIVDIARSSGVQIAIVCFPMRDQVGGEGSFETQGEELHALTWPQRMIARFCDDVDVPYLDLLPAYEAWQPNSGQAADELFLDIYHPTRTGHRFTAEKIAGFLIENGLIACDVGTAP